MADVTKDNIEPKSNTENEISYLVVDKTYIYLFSSLILGRIFFFIFISPRWLYSFKKLVAIQLLPPPPGSKGWGLGQS